MYIGFDVCFHALVSVDISKLAKVLRFYVRDLLAFTFKNLAALYSKAPFKLCEPDLRAGPIFKSRVLPPLLDFSNISVAISKYIYMQFGVSWKDSWNTMFDQIALETCLNQRLEIGLDLFINYPDTAPCFDDIKDCLALDTSRLIIASSLESRIVTELLNPGKRTIDILKFYISLIVCLKKVDPSNIILGILAAPIRLCLRERSDINKCIISVISSENSLIFNEPSAYRPSGSNLNPSSSQSYDNNIAIPSETRYYNSGYVGDDSDDIEAQLNWKPLPIDAEHVQASLRKQNYDILNQLVDIFENKTAFVNEYQRQLSSSLLSFSKNLNETVQIEKAQLKLLRSKFRTLQMSDCLVMIDDMEKSCAVYSKARPELTAEFDVKIVSKEYWPPLQSHDITIPSSFQKIRSEYEKEYEECFPKRKLVWNNSVGTVNLDVELRDRVISLEIPVASAAVLFAINELVDRPSMRSDIHDETVWVSLQDIMNKMDFHSIEAVKRATGTLKQKSVIVEKIGGFTATPITSTSGALVAAARQKRQDPSNIFYAVAETVSMLNQQTGRKLDPSAQGIANSPNRNGRGEFSGSCTRGSVSGSGNLIDNSPNEIKVNGGVDANVDVDADAEGDMDADVGEDESEDSTENFNLYWQYVVGMLTNLGPLDLNRIADMLEMFASDKSFSGGNKQPLKAFLDSKARSGDLLFAPQSGFYSLP